MMRSITDQGYRVARVLARIDELCECVAGPATCRIDELLQTRKQVHRRFPVIQLKRIRQHLNKAARNAKGIHVVK